MAQPRKEGLETLGLRLHKDAIRKIKMIALELDTTASDLATKALTLWWSQQPEAKKYGALFSGEVSSSAPTATPVASKSTPSSPIKAAPQAAGNVTKSDPTKAAKAATAKVAKK